MDSTGPRRDSDPIVSRHAEASTPLPPQHQPPGLFLLFMVEMWERFSYYGMRALLVLYLYTSINPPEGHPRFGNPGRGWSEPDAYKLYGVYTGLAYLLPVMGGFLADKLLGTHRSMLIGAIVIAIGHVMLAISGLGTLGHSDAGMAIFIAGLATIVLGTGYFKPTVTVMVGQLYREGDPRRDGGFSIFYMGINVGAFLGVLFCGLLASKVGWHWGFGAAAVGMVAGLIAYQWGRPQYLKGIGDPPPGKPNLVIPMILGSVLVGAACGYAFHAGILAAIGRFLAWFFSIPFVKPGVIALILGGLAWFVSIQKRSDRGPVFCILVFIFFNALFWFAFEQAGSTLNVFADQSTDRVVFGWEIPTEWFQNFNSAFIVLLAPLFAWTWTSLGKRRMNPSQPVKISLGLIFLGLGYICMVLAAMEAMRGKVSPMYLVLTYLLHTMGELCLSPTGLSFVTKTAPVRFVSFLMGMWFLSSALANLGGGLVAAKVTDIESGKLLLPWSSWFEMGSRAPFFMLFVVSSLGAGLLILAFSPLLKRLLGSKVDA